MSLSLQNISIDAACFVLAFILASMLEYWVHRLMHYSPRFGKVHRDHHRRNEGQGVIKEFLAYIKGACFFMCLLFLVSLQMGIAWFLGCLVYAAFSAYAHQLQHDNPTKCFWMKMPVHYVHHKYNQWHENFGLGVDWWDRIFGTYKPTEWIGEEEESQVEKGHLQLRWW